LFASVKTYWSHAMTPVAVLVTGVRDQHQLRQDCRVSLWTQGNVAFVSKLDREALKRYESTAAKGVEDNHGSKVKTKELDPNMDLKGMYRTDTDKDVRRRYTDENVEQAISSTEKKKEVRHIY